MKRIESNGKQDRTINCRSFRNGFNLDKLVNLRKNFTQNLNKTMN